MAGEHEVGGLEPVALLGALHQPLRGASHRPERQVCQAARRRRSHDIFTPRRHTEEEDEGPWSTHTSTETSLLRPDSLSSSPRFSLAGFHWSKKEIQGESHVCLVWSSHQSFLRLGVQKKRAIVITAVVNLCVCVLWTQPVADKAPQSSSPAAKKKSFSLEEWTPPSEDAGCVPFHVTPLLLLPNQEKAKTTHLNPRKSVTAADFLFFFFYYSGFPFRDKWRIIVDTNLMKIDSFPHFFHGDYCASQVSGIRKEDTLFL